MTKRLGSWNYYAIEKSGIPDLFPGYLLQHGTAGGIADL